MKPTTTSPHASYRHRLRPAAICACFGFCGPILYYFEFSVQAGENFEPFVLRARNYFVGARTCVRSKGCSDASRWVLQCTNLVLNLCGLKQPRTGRRKQFVKLLPGTFPFNLIESNNRHISLFRGHCSRVSAQISGVGVGGLIMRTLEVSLCSSSRGIFN